MSSYKKTFLLSLLLLTFGFSQAQTTVGGTISSNTTWYPSGNPYIVTDSITVNQNVTLTIKPGVLVRFEQGSSFEMYSIVVNGTLRAIGTEDSAITFTSNEFIPHFGDWGAFIFNESAQAYDFSNQTGCILQYCNLEYGGNYSIWFLGNVLIVMKGTSAFIDHCMISNSGNCKAIYSSGTASEIRITNNKFIAMNIGGLNNALIDLAVDSSAEVSCNLFYRDDGFAASGNNLNFHHNLVVKQFDAGFGIGPLNSFHHNTIVDCQTQYNLFEVYGDMDHNTITRNEGPGFGSPRHCINIRDTNSNINHNNIYDQISEDQPFYNIGTYIERETYFTTPLDATHNWFNKNASSEIDQVIRDYKDDTTYYLINYEPYLSSPDIDAPITPPTGVTKTDIGGNNVLVTWNPNPDADVAGYKIYWGNPTGYSFSNSLDVGNVTSYTLTNFFFNDTVAVTAYDADAGGGAQDQCEGHESWFTSDYQFTGISSAALPLNHLRCFPNPADQYTVLDIDGQGNQNTQLVIRSSIGEIMKIIKLDSHRRPTIQLSDLPSGIYQVFLVGENHQTGFLKLAIVR